MNGIMELTHSAGVKRALASAQITSDTDGIVVDTLGFFEVMFAFLIAAVAAADADNYLTAKVYESDASDMTGAVEITDAHRILGTQLVINATTMANSAAKFGVVPTKRYLRLKMDETGTVDATLGAMAVLTGSRHAPVS